MNDATRMKFCSKCGAEVALRIPEGDDRARFMCESCGAIHYTNPKMVVGCIPEWNGEILLCRRAIPPGYGKWTLPAGYLEDKETVYQGIEREALEEAGARVVDLQPFALLNLSFISQIYFMSRAHLLDMEFKPGFESLDVKLFGEMKIPWDQIAFPVIFETLRLYFKDRATGVFPFHVKDIRPSFVL